MDIFLLFILFFTRLLTHSEHSLVHLNQFPLIINAQQQTLQLTLTLHYKESQFRTDSGVGTDALTQSTGLGNKSNPRKLTDSQKKMKRLKEQIEKEKDPEVKAEVKKGNIVTIIEDSMDY